jgi:hypothetical protein
MAVPAHDQRDYEFAELHGLPVLTVVTPPEGASGHAGAYGGDGTMVNSADLDGLTTSEAQAAVLQRLKASGLGGAHLTYRLRDWLVSRQRCGALRGGFRRSPRCATCPCSALLRSPSPSSQTSGHVSTHVGYQVLGRADPDCPLPGMWRAACRRGRPASRASSGYRDLQEGRVAPRPGCGVASLPLPEVRRRPSSHHAHTCTCARPRNSIAGAAVRPSAKQTRWTRLWTLHGTARLRLELGSGRARIREGSVDTEVRLIGGLSPPLGTFCDTLTQPTRRKSSVPRPLRDGCPSGVGV